MPNPAHRRQIAHAANDDNNNNKRTTGQQGAGQQGNPKMAPVKRICGNQIKVAPQGRGRRAGGVVDSIKIKLAALLVANFVIIRCQCRVAVCVCLFCGTCVPTIRCQIQQTTATRPHVHTCHSDHKLKQEQTEEEEKEQEQEQSAAGQPLENQ